MLRICWLISLIVLLATTDAIDYENDSLYFGVIILSSVAIVNDLVSLFSFYIKSACTLFITLWALEQLLIVGFLSCFIDLMVRPIQYAITEHILVGFTVVLYIVFHYILNR